MKESVIQMLEEGVSLRMAQKADDVPEPLRSWPPEKEYVAPKDNSTRRPLFLMFLIMGALTAFIYVKYYL